MKKRVIKKVERYMLVDKICELQRDIDEYDRFIGDMAIMLNKREPQCVIEHNCNELAGWVWDAVRRLIKENADLRAKTSSGD